MKPLTDQERRLIDALDRPLPLTEEPYAAAAQAAGLTQDEALAIIRGWKESGVLRRFGARLRHHAVGYTANGMSVWNVPAELVEAAAAVMTAMPQVSHCYQRRMQPGWGYNMYAMIHGKSREEVAAVAAEIAQKSGIRDYDILYSVTELKKSAPKYGTGH